MVLFYIYLVLMKNTDYTFDLDVATHRESDGKIKLFLGIDRVRKQKSLLECDSVNNVHPYRLGFKRFKKNKTFKDRINEVQKEVEMVNDVEHKLTKSADGEGP